MVACWEVMALPEGVAAAQLIGEVVGCLIFTSPLQLEVLVHVQFMCRATVESAQAWDAELGKEVFENNCAVCHTGGGNTLMPDKTLKQDAIKKYLDGGFNISAIVYQVRIRSLYRAFQVVMTCASCNRLQGVAAM